MKLIILLTLALFGLLYVLSRVLRERKALAEHSGQLTADLEDFKAAVEPIYRLLSPNGESSVFTHITEIRELTVGIRKHSPEMFEQVPGLLNVLQASDEYLCRLIDAALPKGLYVSCDIERQGWECSWEISGLTPHIYGDIRTLIVSR